jgi:drug/metabolite transporter (DMT)-like permease
MAALATTITLWASAFVGIRAVLQEGAYDPFRLAFLRYFVASLVLLAVARPMGVRLPKGGDLPRILFSGLLGVAIYNSLLNLGQTQMKAGAASFIVNTIPLFTALLSILCLQDRLRPVGVAGMALSFAGIILIALGEGKTFELNWGAFVILVAAVSWSIATILQKPLLVEYRAIEIVSYAIWSGTLCMVIFAPGLGEQIGAASLRATTIVVLLGIFPAAVAYVTWAYVLGRFPASRASSFLYLIPPLSTLIEVLWLGDFPGKLSLLGGAMALGGVVLTNTLGRVRQ